MKNFVWIITCAWALSLSLLVGPAFGETTAVASAPGPSLEGASTEGTSYSLPRKKFFTLTATSTLTAPPFSYDENAAKSAAVTSGRAKKGGKSKGGKATPGDPVDNSSAATDDPASRVRPGYSLRHLIAGEFQISENARLGPVLDLSEPFYGRNDGNLVFNDPHLKLSLEDLMKTRIGENPMSSHASFSYFYPASKQSRAQNVQSALSASFGPRVRFAHSRFSVAGSATAKMTIIDHIGNGWNTPTRFQIGLQTNYQATKNIAPFIMPYWSFKAGPRPPTSDDMVSTPGEGGAGKGPFGLGVGTVIRATNWISLTPRWNWYLSQPIGTSTITLAANIKLI